MTTMTPAVATKNGDKSPWIGFVDKLWQVHKFGGTSVADADCFCKAAKIVEEQLGIANENGGKDNETIKTVTGPSYSLAVVVSAMGGKPKVTDLLLDSVTAASKRDDAEVNRLLGLVIDKHKTCLQDLFGGSNGDSDRLSAVIERDMGEIRDILKTVSLMKWNAKRISELVSGYGEIWSSQILAMLLQNRSVERNKMIRNQSSSSLHETTEIYHEFVYIDARRIITIDEEAIQDGAVAWDVSSAKLQEVYEAEMSQLAATTKDEDSFEKVLHLVITGYVASNLHGVATTLQRDGSDYSAAIMGRLLKSNNVTIWTDVDGVLSADPRRVPTAYALPEVSYNEAMELAYFGAKVIHPKTMQPAISCNPQIPIYIRNTFNSKFPGTRIYTTSTTQTDPDKCVCGFSSIEHMALVNVEGSGLIGVPGVATRMFGTLERMGVNVVLISQASSEHTITFATLDEQAAAAREAIEEEFQRELKQSRISNISVKSPCSIIAAVGDGMREMAGVSGRFFTALGDAKINVLAISQGCSERNISAVVMTHESTRALQALHSAFRLSHTVCRIGIIGMNELGESLLKLLETQRSILRSTFEIDLQVRAIVADPKSTDIVCMKSDKGDENSITLSAYMKARGEGSNQKDKTSPQAVSFNSIPDEDVATMGTGGASAIIEKLFRDDFPHHTVFDCTNDQTVGELHAEWLRAGVHVVTANNMGLSGNKEQRDAISAAERVYGKQSAQYLREVTVAGGLPVISTLRTLLSAGDKIRRIDGIFSVSMSYIMFRISPPLGHARCSQFDQETTKYVFPGDLSLSSAQSVGEPCSLSQAVKEAVALGLMEEDPSKDLGNEYTARVLMVLSKELGLDRDLSTKDIQGRSDKLWENETDDYKFVSDDVDRHVALRVKAAADRGCVLRQISSVDMKTQSVDIKVLEVPNDHLFAVTPPTCGCVRLFTQRYQSYPLVIQGPAAGADCTSSALLAELLHLLSSKVGPKTGALSRTGSSAWLS